MESHGVVLAKDSFVFPSPSILDSIEEAKGEFRSPILKEAQSENSDEFKSSLDMTASKSWVNQMLQTAFNKSIQSFDEELGKTRFLGTHTGRNTFILICLLVGSVCRDPITGELQWSKADYDSICKTARMSMETLIRFYVRDSQTTIEHIRDDQEGEYDKHLDYFRASHLGNTIKANETDQQTYHFCPEKERRTSLSIFSYINRRFGFKNEQIVGALDYFKEMEKARGHEANKKEVLALHGEMRSFFKENVFPDLRNKVAYVEDVKEKFKTYIYSLEKLQSYEPSSYHYKQNNLQWNGQSKTYTIHKERAISQLERAKQIQTAKEKARQTAHVDEDVTEGMALELIRQVKVAANASQQLELVLLLREKYSLMNRWYYRVPGAQCRGAKSCHRKQGDFFKKWEPIMRCWDGICLSNQAADKSLSKPLSVETVKEFIHKNRSKEDMDPRFTEDKLKSSYWTKNKCLCIEKNKNKKH